MRAMLFVAACSVGSTGAAAEPPLVLERTIALANTPGRIDHMAIDLARRRLIVAEVGNDTVDIVDLDTGKLVHRIDGLSDPQGVVYAPQSDRIVVADGGDGSVRIFSGTDFAQQKTVSLGDDADNARLDPRNGHAIIGYGSGGLAVIDPAAGTELASIALPDHPEAFDISSATAKVYVNVPSAHEIDVASVDGGNVVARPNPPQLSANFPMALAAAQRLVAVAFRGPPKLALFDMDKGSLVSESDTCADADDVYFDEKRDRFYVSCGAGQVAVYRLAAGHLEPLAQIPTSSGARTSLFVPELDRLFVAVPAGWFGSDASLLVFRPEP